MGAEDAKMPAPSSRPDRAHSLPPDLLRGRLCWWATPGLLPAKEDAPALPGNTDGEDFLFSGTGGAALKPCPCPCWGNPLELLLGCVLFQISLCANSTNARSASSLMKRQWWRSFKECNYWAVTSNIIMLQELFMIRRIDGGSQIDRAKRREYHQ